MLNESDARPLFGCRSIYVHTCCDNINPQTTFKIVNDQAATLPEYSVQPCYRRLQPNLYIR